VIGAAPDPIELDITPAVDAVRKLVESGAKPRVAAGVVAELTGASANTLYRALTAQD
jgi:16S rRNA (cytidine1402-2'-O)-methyltransferase